MSVNKVSAYRCSDGALFVTEGSADQHEALLGYRDAVARFFERHGTYDGVYKGAFEEGVDEIVELGRLAMVATGRSAPIAPPTFAAALARLHLQAGYRSCQHSPVNTCAYVESDTSHDACIYCGAPEERK